MKINIIYNKDSIGKKGMVILPDKSIDMVLCDLPYGRTACKWDTIIPFELLWEQYKRVIKDNGVIALTGTQPFTSKLIVSNLKMFRYEWIWQKSTYTNFYFVKKQPAKKHENICIFYKKQPTYNPQMERGESYIDKRKKKNRHTDLVKISLPKIDIKNKGIRFPSTIQFFNSGNNKLKHPTQKPIALFEYLIKTYTNEGDIVLDNCIGSGTTAVACKRLNRKYIGYEIEKKYYDIAIKRLEAEKTLWN